MGKNQHANAKPNNIGHSSHWGLLPYENNQWNKGSRNNQIIDMLIIFLNPFVYLPLLQIS